MKHIRKTEISHGLERARALQELLIQVETREGRLIDDGCLGIVDDLRNLSYALKLNSTNDLLHMLEQSFILVRDNAIDPFPELFNWWFRILAAVRSTFREFPSTRRERKSLVEMHVSFHAWLYNTKRRCMGNHIEDTNPNGADLSIAAFEPKGSFR